MKRIMVLMLALTLLASIFTACSRKTSEDDKGETNTNAETTIQELSDQQLKALAYINENGKNVLPVYQRYVYAGEVEVDDHKCDRFEFYTDEMFLGAIAKAKDEDIMYWDPENGKYMFMEYDNDGWYVTGRLVNEPTIEYSENADAPKLDDGLSGQYTMGNSSFYITLYAEDYAGDADGFFRASGITEDKNGLAKQFALAGEFYLSEEEVTLVYTENETATEQIISFSKSFEYKKGNESIKFSFGEDSVFISDAGVHNVEEYNLTGVYSVVTYY